MRKNTKYIFTAALVSLAALLSSGRLAAQNQIDLELGSKDITITSSTWIVGEDKIGNRPTSYNPATDVIRIYMKNQPRVTKTSGGSLIIENPEGGSTESSVANIIKGWNDSGHSKASGRIHVKGDDAVTIRIIIEDCFSTYQIYSQGRRTGGLGFEPQVNGAKLEVRLKGDNRFGNVAYSTGTFDKCQLIFTSAEGDGNTSGTLTVADINYDTHKYTFNDGTSYEGCYNNWYNSVIGGGDDEDVENSIGIVIKGGTIYAGALERDNCTAIGAGGNGYGTVTITGGIVTAVTASTGTAIGGGIGWQYNGGASEVNITGGKVYAYNHGFAHLYKGSNKYVPATAIGGGSSFEQSSNPSTINISGASTYVYAQSVGGVAIGGGGSGMGNAGNATVNITDATVHASNVAGNVTSIVGGDVGVPAGTSIGGGTGGIGMSADVPGNGGSATVKISGTSKLIAGSIGGGSTNSTMGGIIGYADITIEGNPLIQGQFMMQKSSQGCSFTMNGGTIDNSQDNSSHYVFKQPNGGALCMIDEDATARITAGSIYGCNVPGKGGAIYMKGGKFVMTGGTIGNKEKPNVAASDGGGVYIDVADNPAKKSVFEMSGSSTKSIIYNQAGGSGGGVYVADGTVTVDNGVISNNKAKTGNGGGIYTTSNVTITGASEINDNSAKLSGGGVYVTTSSGSTTVTLTGTESKKSEINGNTASGSYTSTCGGGGVYLSSGTVNLTNATVDNNNAPDGLGGGIYIGSGNINIYSGSASSNTAYDGGGLYAGGGKITFENGGQINLNVASHHGGGVYGSEAYIDFKGDSAAGNFAVISYNQARNGGGIFMCNGAVMVVKAAFLNGNRAIIDEAEAAVHPIPASAFWSYTKNPGANNKQYLQGVGGGVYLDSGSPSSITVLKFVVNAGESLGIFSNMADIAADDIFANGEHTNVIIPPVDEMEFEGFGGSPTGWYEDYMTNDVAYASGTFENNRSGATGIRYRTAYQSGLNMFRVDTEKANAENRYICLALGDPFSNLVIKVSGLKSGESAVYTCTKDGDTKPTYYVVITGTSDDGAEVSRTIKNVPIGDWIVEQTDWSWAYNLSSEKKQTGNVGIGTDHTPVMTYVNSANTEATRHGESITKNVFDTTVTAVESAGVIKRNENNTNIEL